MGGTCCKAKPPPATESTSAAVAPENKGGGCCCCLKKAADGEVFKPASARACTDIICLLLMLLCLGFASGIAGYTVHSHPTLLTDLYAPPDNWGNNCGRGFMMKKPVLVYPRLDSDFVEQYAVVSTGQYWRFKPTGYCAEECPTGFDLSNPIQYGGLLYGCNKQRHCDQTVPTYYYTYLTTNMLGRCIPSAATLPAETRNLCVVPSCTSTQARALNTTYPHSINCASIKSQPDSRNTWQVCPPGCTGRPGDPSTCCGAQKNACELEVTEAITESFTPAAKTEDDVGFTQKFATYVQLTIGGAEGLIVPDGLLCMTVFGLSMPIGIGFIWAIFLWFFAGVMVYLISIFLVLLMGLIDFILAAKAGWFTIDPKSQEFMKLQAHLNKIPGIATSNFTLASINSTANETWQKWYTALAIIFIIATILLVIFLVANRKALDRLVGILRETTKVFKAMFGIVLWPFWDILFQTVFFVYFIFILIFTVNSPPDLYPSEAENGVAVAFVVFVYYWISQFIRATIWTSMSAAICRWYITQNEPDQKRCCGIGHGLNKLFSGTCLIICKHLGTMAFGALIIAIVQTIRTVVMYIDQQTQQMQNQNLVLKVVMKGVQCCLACLQKTIEVITYYGFVFVAMQGQPFCKACYSTFVFVISNPAQVAINKVVVKILVILIGLSTPVISACAAFAYLEWCSIDPFYKDKYNNLVAVAVTFLISYIVTTGVVSIYECAIDSIFLCAFKDMADNKPPKYMSNDLRKAFGLDLADEEAFLIAGSPPSAKSYKTYAQREAEAKAAKRDAKSAPAVATADGV